MLQELKKKVMSGEVRLGDALGRTLPTVRGNVADDRVLWMVNEMNGYPNALDWYSHPTHDFPPYRVVNGRLRSVDKDGNFGEVNHPLASKGRYFLAAPISWLEDASTMGGLEALVEMQELSAHFARATGGGGVVCSCSKDEVNRILANVKQNILALITEILVKSPSA